MAQSGQTHEYRIKSMEQQIDDHHSSIHDMQDRIKKLQYWRDGNGARGAEQRLLDVERHMITEARVSELIERNSEQTANYIIDTLDKKGNHRLRDIMTLLSTLGTIGAVIVMIIALGG